MKIAAIYNIWDGEELLIPSMKCLDGHVDLFILTYQTKSNFGEVHNPMKNGKFKEIQAAMKTPCELALYEPVITEDNSNGTINETQKRNFGLYIAKKERCTHFLFMDCDEFYQDFGGAKKLYIALRKGHGGSVCAIETYFGKPTLKFSDVDNYKVPFIHELHKNTQAGVRKYPFYVDPTRRVNEQDVVDLPVTMQHYSWVRKNIERKMRNSSARTAMLRLENIVPEVQSAHEGMSVKDMSNRVLVTVPDYFNLTPIFK